MSKLQNTKKKWIINCVQSQGKLDDWKTTEAYQAYLLDNKPPQSASAVDLREDWWHIKDQEEAYSCVGWATADSLLRWHFVKNNYINKDTTLSARYIWMAAKEIDELNTRPTTFIQSEGSTIKAALDVARKYGVVTEKLIPSNNDQMYQGTATEFYASAARLKIQSYYNLLKDVDSKHKFIIWKKWLAEGNGPIIIRVNVDDSWYDASKYNGYLSSYDENKTYGGHATALVGYTKDNNFIVRNTWGTAWGDSGFAYISEEYAHKAIDEAYGATVISTESTIKVVDLPHRRPPPDWF